MLLNSFVQHDSFVFKQEQKSVPLHFMAQGGISCLSKWNQLLKMLLMSIIRHDLLLRVIGIVFLLNILKLMVHEPVTYVVKIQLKGVHISELHELVPLQIFQLSQYQPDRLRATETNISDHTMMRVALRLMFPFMSVVLMLV